MNRYLSVFSLLSFTVLFLTACTNVDPGSKWINLLDGEQGMNNFNVVGGANWHAMDGTIMATENSGARAFLVSKNAYGDFRLRVEIWVSHDGNSGVFMRCDSPDTISSRACYEVNVSDQAEDPKYGTGSIVRVAPITLPMVKAGGKWNVLEIIAEGNHLQVILNGTKTIDIMDSAHGSGVFGLQWNGGIIKFRKVDIMPL